MFTHTYTARGLYRVVKSYGPFWAHREEAFIERFAGAWKLNTAILVLVRIVFEYYSSTVRSVFEYYGTVSSIAVPAMNRRGRSPGGSPAKS